MDKAAPRTALIPAASVLAGVTWGGCYWPGGSPEEHTTEEGAPGGAAGSRGSEEASEAIEGLVVHRVILHEDAGCGTG
jgi:hypothetical protein